jgi:MFS family permease
MTKDEKKIILASSVGTIFEWYDFYLFGSLATIIAHQFFSALDTQAAFMVTLLGFAAGFLVRPFGALFFGRMGDMIGRKYTFLLTILLMGLSTFAVGILPTYEQAGVVAPIILIVLRLLQGLALGGEYGGAATYVAEHSPPQVRGMYTSWIQTTATLGFLLSLLMVLGTRWLLGGGSLTEEGDKAFADYGWRIPFLVSIVLLGVSVYIRLSLDESPAFAKMKARSQQSKTPIKDSFGQWRNLKVVLLALFGLTAGQAVVWYTGQFYALFFMTQALQVDATQAQLLMSVALLIGAPFFVIFGALSDKVGRKPIIMLGCLLASVTYFPTFHALTKAANPQLAYVQQLAQVTVYRDTSSCSFLSNPIEQVTDYRSSCDIARNYLAQNSVSYDTQTLTSNQSAYVRIGTHTIVAPEGQVSGDRFTPESEAQIEQFQQAVAAALREAGYPTMADPQRIDRFKVVLILSYLIILVAMVYGPIAAMLVEMFPTRIRYTSMSLPYHIGNGWLGGLLPSTAFAVVAHTGNMYSGLWYPVVIAGVCFVIGMIFLRDTRKVDIYASE